MKRGANKVRGGPALAVWMLGGRTSVLVEGGTISPLQASLETGLAHRDEGSIPKGINNESRLYRSIHAPGRCQSQNTGRQWRGQEGTAGYMALSENSCWRRS